MKLHAFAELVRMDLAFGAGFFFVAGEILAYGGLPPLDLVLYGFLALFFIAGSANISNDFFDREVDKVNMPSRPLPSGRVTVPELFLLFTIYSALGLLCAAFLGWPVLVLVSLCWAVAFLYNMKLKESGFAGNLVVASCIAMIFVIGGLAVGEVNGVVLTFAALAFLFDLGLEVAADALDARGDELRSGRSIASRKGKGYAMRISGTMLAVFFLLTPLPYLKGWLEFDYILLIGAADALMIYFAARLVRCRTIPEGRNRMRGLYLTWGTFVIVFALTRLL